MDKNIRDYIKEIVKSDSEIYSSVCTVDEVNGNTIDVTPLDGRAPLIDVKIVAGTSETPFKITPVVGSQCIVTFISEQVAYASMFSEVESIELRGDENGGVIIASDLVDQLNILSARVNTIYSAIENAIPFTGSADGGTALQNSMKAILSTQAQTEDFSDIESETVKHG